MNVNRDGANSLYGCDPEWPLRGLSANQLARALISMMARSATHSTQRPDTLMQDRSQPDRRKPLATHGRTIHWVMCGRRPRVKGFFWLSACGRVQVMCPACLCGAMTAGPDVIRRSSPYLARTQECLTHSGFSRSPVQPVRIKPSSPSTFLYALDVTSHSQCRHLQAAAVMAALLKRFGAR